jgi:hypothetical protein
VYFDSPNTIEIQAYLITDAQIIIIFDNLLCYHASYISLEIVMDKSIFLIPPLLIGFFFLVCTAAYLLSLRLAAHLFYRSVPWVNLIALVFLAFLNDPLRITIVIGLASGVLYQLFKLSTLQPSRPIAKIFIWSSISLGGMIINAAFIMFRDNLAWFSFLIVWGFITALPSIVFLRHLSQMPYVFEKQPNLNAPLAESGD